MTRCGTIATCYNEKEREGMAGCGTIATCNNEKGREGMAECGTIATCNNEKGREGMAGCVTLQHLTICQLLYSVYIVPPLLYVVMFDMFQLMMVRVQ